MAEVVVDDVTWIVARPFAIGPHPFCIRGGTIGQVTDGSERLDYQEFLKAIGAATGGRLSAARFPASDESGRWEHVLPWLARDQEFRFADFLEWRHSSSDSEAPALSVDERQFVVRSMLGLISDEERVEQQKNARLVSQKQEAAEQGPLFLHQAETDHARVCSALGMELPPPSNPLFGYQARAELDQRTAELRKREEALSRADRRMDLRNALEQAGAAETHARRNLQDTETRLKWAQTAVAQLAGNVQSALFVALPPAGDHCQVPMSLAREKHWPLALFRPVDLAARRSEQTAAEELDIQRQLVQMLETAAADNRSALAAADAATKRARRDFLSAATAFDEQREKLFEEKARLSQIARRVEDAETAWRRASEHTEAVTRIDREIRESYDRQEQLRSDRQEALRAFSARFDYVVRALLGDEVAGRVDAAGRSLSLIIEEHGERDSAAIATIKLLAFDLAALTTSAEGYGTFPRFLIHDGPREADLSPDIYERLFFYARELEKCFSGAPSFQYILTTTTRPPEILQRNPWLRLKLSGVPTEERLLRCDL